MGRLRHLLRAKAVLCPGLRMSLSVEAKPEENESWLFEDGLRQYLRPPLAMRNAYRRRR